MFYLVLKTLHVVSVFAWMAGLFYLPRLFVYHADAGTGGEASQTFKVMERRLLKAIMTPAMLASWIFGLATAAAIGFESLASSGWFHAKLALVVLMSLFHMRLAWHVRTFAEDRNTASSRYFRIINEIPTVLLIAIVALVIIKPF